LHSEVSELLDAVGGPWKTHVSNYDATRKSQVLSEAVDIVKLAMEVAMVYDVGEQEFFKKFLLKSKIVDYRRKSEQFLMKKVTNPVVFDFDGVLADYPGPFLDFLEPWTGAIKVDSPDNLWSSTGLDVPLYESLKREYWETSGPLKAPEIACTVRLIRLLKSDNIPVVIVTSRDRNYLENAEHSTYQWLERHDIEVDGVYFTSDKPRFIKKNFSDATIVVDDDEATVSKLEGAGIISKLVNSTNVEDLPAFEEIEAIIYKRWYPLGVFI
jgi:hypothetical protein